MKKKKPTYIAIRNIPIRALLSWKPIRLGAALKNIDNEIDILREKLRVAILSKRWIEGIKRFANKRENGDG